MGVAHQSTQALLAQGGAARLARRRTKGFESGDMTRKMAETSRGATVRNVPGTRSEARRSERSVTFVTLGLGLKGDVPSEPGNSLVRPDGHV